MKTRKQLSGKFVKTGAYPLMICGGLLLHTVLKGLGMEPVMASYIPIILGAALITILELYFPVRTEWTGNKEDWINDWIYMLLVQVGLPKILQLGVMFALLEYVNFRNLFPFNLWPHEWTNLAQATLMVFAADFLRYWLHRWSHETVWLWRLHAVHHSPHKLYWVNVARFHPVEKSIQFLFDTLPFMLIGVSPEVLGYYAVFYSINGFFQHSNIDVRLGFLNYVISGPELHRWHHSRWPVESNRNYGNNLIVWDLLFGTRFLPEEREVELLGLPNREYPMGFWEQMQTPFLKGIEKG